MGFNTPNDPGFEGVGEGCSEEALFLVKEASGKRAVCEVHLCDCDEDSPSGFGWDYTVYKWEGDGGGWTEWDGGVYWDYPSADDMTDFTSELPADFGDVEIRLAGKDGPSSLTIDDLADESGEHRMFTDEEWEAATPV